MIRSYDFMIRELFDLRVDNVCDNFLLETSILYFLM